MFQHILFPTDGQAPSRTALGQCVAFAKACGARLTAVHVVRPFHVLTTDAEMLRDTPETYAAHRQARARACLEQVAESAREQGVVYETLIVEHEDPYQAIIEAARIHHCDLIAMASHGRRGMRGMLLGSETQKVLTHSTLPVLVYR